MSDIKVGQIIELTDGRRAVVRFVGLTHFAPGDWIGIELEDDSGKNDGAVQGERYFDCAPARGMFVRPTTINIIQQPAPRPAARPRPSSMTASTGAAARRPSTVTDPTHQKRMSLNAPSPSPVPKPARPTSLGRVSPSLASCWPRLLLFVSSV